jgi:hypothetical protein
MLSVGMLVDDVQYTCAARGNFMYCSSKLLSRKYDDRSAGKTITGTVYSNKKMV